MAPYTSDTGATTSVSSKVIVPSMAVVSVLCLIAFAGAVVVFVRAYRARNRRKEHEGRAAERRRRRGGGGGGRRGDDKSPAVVAAASATAGPRGGEEDKCLEGAFSRRDMFADPPSSPPPPQLPPPPPQEAARPCMHGRRALEDRYQRGRIVDSIAEGMALCGPAYGAAHYRYQPPGIETSGGVFPAVPTVGKAERVLGTPVPSDLYADRASWSRWQATTQIRRHHSAPAHIRGAPSPPPSGPLPRTPCTDGTETTRETPLPEQRRAPSVSPTPPPPTTPPPVTIEEKYPNVGALGRASPPISKPVGRLSYTLSVNNSPTEHIYTQHSYSPPPHHRHRHHHQQNRQRRSNCSSNSSMHKILLDPPSPSPLGSPFFKPRRTTAESLARASSWSGRSILDLDAMAPDSHLDPAGSPPLYRCYSSRSFSSASSFNTLTPAVVPLHGLSPTPPRPEERSIGTVITDVAEKDGSGAESETKVGSETGFESETGAAGEAREAKDTTTTSERARMSEEERRVSWEMCKAWVGNG